MTIRIISGERRGAKLQTPEGELTRPLRDRVRQALFNVLRDDVRGAVVLDAFAGTGAVGLEALSNGAEHATFIEVEPDVAQLIRGNIAKLGYASRSLVVEGASPGSIEKLRPGAPFTLLFLMPSYHSGLCETVLGSEGVLARCAAGAVAVCEVHRDEAFAAPAGWRVMKEKRYGITRLLFLLRDSKGA